VLAEKMGTTRVVYADVLRIVAILGVIVLHTAASKWDDAPVTSLDWQFMNFWDSLMRWSVPVFIMISGMFFLKPAAIEDDFKAELKYIRHKVFRIIRVIIVWGIIYNVWDPVDKYITSHDASGFSSLWQLPSQILLHPAYYHLWFLYLIIGMYLLAPILRRFIKNARKEHLEYCLILFAILGTGIPFADMILKAIYRLTGNTAKPSIYFPVAEFSGDAGFFIAGYYFATYEIKTSTRKIMYSLAIVSLLITIVGNSIASVYAGEAGVELYGNFPTTMIISFALFIFIKQCFQKDIGEKWAKRIEHTSKLTFGIYLIHVLVLQVLDIAGINTLLFSPIITIPLLAIVIWCVSCIASAIFDKVPVLKRILV
jgi:surface polysaccharide O-acyltransferase-like enzyme